MFFFALSEALTVTIVYIFVWGIFFPGLVTGLIAFAIFQARAEEAEYQELRRHRQV